MINLITNMRHLVMPKILILLLIVALKRGSAQMNKPSESSNITTLEEIKTMMDSINANDGTKTDPPKKANLWLNQNSDVIPKDGCKLFCEICEDQQFNNALCQNILQKCNNCTNGPVVTTPNSLQQKNAKIPDFCADWACKLCSISGLNPLCPGWLVQCGGCKFFYGVDPGRINVYRGNRLQQGINWWGPEFLVEFDITVTASEFPKIMYNVLQVSKERPGNIGPRQENIPGVWVLRNLPDNVQRIVIQISYFRNNFIYLDYEVGRKYHIQIVQAAVEDDDWWPFWGGERCITFPKNNGYDIYVLVDNKLHARRNIEDASVFGTQGCQDSSFECDWECPKYPKECTSEGWCTCRWCSGRNCCPLCPRDPWDGVAIWASSQNTDAFTDDFGILENLVLKSQTEKISIPCFYTCLEDGDPDCKLPYSKKGQQERLLSFRNQSMILPSGNMPEQHFGNMSLFQYAKSLGVDFSHQLELDSIF